MVIVLSTDDNFVQHCCAAMVSILRNNKDVIFYILCESIFPENKKILQEIAEANSGVCQIISVSHSIVKQFPMPEGEFIGHISVATYYRLLVSSLLPSNIERCIYLDCDIIVRGSLEDLYNTDIRDKAIAAVYQDDPQWVNAEVYEKLSIPRQYGYFNAGVLLINLDYWRINNVENRLINYINKNYSKILFHDQDTLNGTLYKETVSLSCRWNMLSYFLKNCLYSVSSEHCLSHKRDICDSLWFNPIVIHFVSRLKPWEFGCRNPYCHEYYYCLRQTPFNKYKPQFKINRLVVKEIVRNSWLFKHLCFVDKSDSYRY